MSGIGTVFNRGLDGINVALKGLATASNNIANINTKGYARQQIVVSPRLASADGVGGGAEVVAVQSIVSPFVEMQLFTTANRFGTYDGRRPTVTQIENIWADSQQNGIGKSLSDYFNAWSSLANDPSSSSLRQTVVSIGETVAGHFNTVSSQLKQLKRDLSSEISDRADKINEMLGAIAGLNQNISEAGGPNKAQDMASQRTYLLRQLSEEMSVAYFEDPEGNVQVTTENGTALVNRYDAATLSVTNNLGYNGNIAIGVTLPGDTTALDITSRITGGRLGGNLIERNTTLNQQIADIDELAYEFVTEINGLHSTGFGLDGSTNNLFFAALGSSQDAAANIRVDANVQNNLNLVAAAGADPTTTGVGNNTMALQIFGLRNSQVMSGNTQTFTDYYRGIVGEAGSLSASIQQNFDLQQKLLTQTEIQRESISGVNLDEEGATIIQYQKAFQASSRIMGVANELMDALLRI